MNYFEKMLLNYLRGGKIKMEITGLDVDGFSKAMQEETQRRLDMIECIVFEDDGRHTDTMKVETIKRLFEKDFYSEE